MGNPRIFLTSDQHFYHRNANRLCGRPWSTVEEMNAALLENINSVVGENDILYHLGDFAFGKKANFWEYMDMVKCKNIHFCLGNHDHKTDIRGANEERKRLLSVTKRIDTSFYHKRTNQVYSMTMTHHPLLDGSMSESRIYCHGHQHRHNPVVRKNQFDIGCDGHAYMPWSIDEVIELYLSLQ